MGEAAKFGPRRVTPATSCPHREMVIPFSSSPKNAFPSQKTVKNAPAPAARDGRRMAGTPRPSKVVDRASA